LIDLLSIDQDEIKENAIWVLGNIASENTTYRDLLLDSGILPPLLKILKCTSKLPIIKIGAWCLDIMNRNHPFPKFNKVKDAIKVICQLINENEDVEILIDCCWNLFKLSDRRKKRIPYLMACDIFPRLVSLLEHPCLQIAMHALSILGNVMSDDDNQTKRILGMGMLGPLGKLMDHPKNDVQATACWVVSNIASGNSTQVEVIIDSGLLNKAIKFAQTGSSVVKKEALCVIGNSILGAEPRHITYIVQNGAIQILCTLLLHSSNPISLESILLWLENLLKKGRDFFIVIYILFLHNYRIQSIIFHSQFILVED